jgi:hypothetical protein
LHWRRGLEEHEHKYSTKKRFHAVSRTGNSNGVVFQDEETDKIYMTWFVEGETSDFESSSTVELPSDFGPSSWILFSATSDGLGRIFYFLVCSGGVDKSLPPSMTNMCQANMFSVDSTTGALLRTKSLNTFGSAGAEGVPNSNGGLNIRSPGGSPPAGSMAFRPAGSGTYTNASIGMNIAAVGWGSHQGATGVIMDANTFDVLNTAGMAAHSFANRLAVSNDGTKFSAVDLGDNYPRGITLYQYDETRSDKALVYSFKAHHSTGPTTPEGNSFPVYPDISGENDSQGRQFYKWSNDNNVYTEITQLVELGPEKGGRFLVFFAGERRPLDNTQIGNNINNPRNLGVVRVKPTAFGKANATGDIIRLPGDGSSDMEHGGFYTFAGSWSKQSNTGLLWLTSFGGPEVEGSTDLSESVTRIKAVHIGTNLNLVVYEVWATAEPLPYCPPCAVKTNSKYLRTMLLLVDDDGAIVEGPTKCDYPMQLAPADDMQLVSTAGADGTRVAFSYSGSRDPSGADKIVRFEICVGSCGNTIGSSNDGPGDHPTEDTESDKDSDTDADGVEGSVVRFRLVVNEENPDNIPLASYVEAIAASLGVDSHGVYLEVVYTTRRRLGGGSQGDWYIRVEIHTGGTAHTTASISAALEMDDYAEKLGSHIQEYAGPGHMVEVDKTSIEVLVIDSDYPGGYDSGDSTGTSDNHHGGMHGCKVAEFEAARAEKCGMLAMQCKTAITEKPAGEERMNALCTSQPCAANFECLENQLNLHGCMGTEVGQKYRSASALCTSGMSAHCIAHMQAAAQVYCDP